MKVLMISDFSIENNGGIETHIKNLGGSLAKKYGATVDFLAGDSLPGFKFFGKNVRLTSELKRRIDHFRPDVVHIHGFASMFVYQSLLLCLRTKYKVVYTPHYHPFNSLKRPFVGKLFFKFFQSNVIKNANAIIALTSSEEVFFKDIEPTGEVYVVPNGAHLDPVNRERGSRERSLLFVGRNDHNKRLDFLLNQKEFFNEEQIVLHIVTNKELKNSPPFYFYTNLSRGDLDSLYRRVSGVTIPSKYEAFSLVALEALSNSAWVLASDQVQIKDYFASNPYFTSFIYNDTGDFQAKVRKMLSSADFDENVLSFELSKFSWDRIAESIFGIYEKVMIHS